MIKSDKGSAIVVFLVIIVIVLAGILGYTVFDKKKEEENVTQNTTNVTQNTSDTFDEASETSALESSLQNIKPGLSFVTVLSSVDSYNNGGIYQTKKNSNLLENPEDRQLFVMEQILSDSSNNNYFIVIDMSGNIDKSGTAPTTEGATAYYPYELFQNEYSKYFAGTFDVEKRKTSNMKLSYDNNSNYIYYENRRAGANGLSVTEITVGSVEQSSSGEFKANLTLNYSGRLSEMLGVSSEKAELIYTKNGNKIQIKSYVIV